jgi:hypothetical protein
MSDRKLHETISLMAEGVVRIPCSKVLMSPEMYRGCLDRLAWWDRELDNVPSIAGNIFIYGAPAEMCYSLSGMEYALVPAERSKYERSTDEESTFKRFDTDKLLKALNLFIERNSLMAILSNGHCSQGLSWSAEEAIAYVAGAMLDPEVRKRVLEAMVFEPE